jgi:hypothetical protein
MKSLSSLIFSGIASLSEDYLGRKEYLLNFFIEDCAGHLSGVIMAKNGVLCEERANMPDLSGTC